MQDAKYEYVGSKKCKKCHSSNHKSWAKTKIGQAFESLKPGVDKEVKEKFGLDPDKDYSTDEKCLPCHTVGFKKPGGYAVPDPADRKAVRAAADRENVGCESCHGPGSAYLDVFDEIMKSKRTYKVEELYEVGLAKMGEQVCTECHNDKSPTFDKDKPFDFEGTKTDSTHEHKPLKQREG